MVLIVLIKYLSIIAKRTKITIFLKKKKTKIDDAQLLVQAKAVDGIIEFDGREHSHMEVEPPALVSDVQDGRSVFMLIVIAYIYVCVVGAIHH